MEENNYILFEQYINKELSDIENSSFEEKLTSDTNFKQEFEIYSVLNSSLSSKFENEEEEIALRKTLTDLGSTYNKKTAQKKTKVISLYRYQKLMVAASIALLIGFFVFNNGDPVYEDFSNHNSLELVVRGNNNNLINNAQQAFNTKDYKAALKHLTVLSNIYTQDSEIKLYKGICQLELGNYYEATQIFKKLSEGSSIFSSSGKWYMALTYLKQENFIECERVLNTISEDADEYEMAKKLLKKL